MKEFSTRNVMLHILGRFDIKHMTIHFDGGGDSGQIVDIRDNTSLRASVSDPVEKLKALTVEGIMLAVAADYTDVEYHDAIRGLFGQHCHTMTDVIDDWAYALLEETHYDWVNNEGGFGAIHIDVEQGKITCEMSIRIVSSEDHEIEL